ncbi:MAG TPA: hypothetical protein PLQ78_10700, partial [Flavipsychrobacter sp.]|nr:hypothetical protein [Flavipsychrobacter sp.]
WIYSPKIDPFFLLRNPGLLGQPVYETNYTYKGNTAILQLQPDQQLSKGLYYLKLYNGLLQHTAFFTVQ